MSGQMNFIYKIKIKSLRFVRGLFGGSIFKAKGVH